MARVRVARARDAAAISAIAEVSLPESWSEPALRDELLGCHTRALVVTEDATRASPIAGFALGRLVERELQLLLVAVAPDERRRGLGRALLEAYIARMREEGAERLTLEVREGNVAARGLYEALGLVLEGRRPRFYRNGETALLYGMPL